MDLKTMKCIGLLWVVGDGQVWVGKEGVGYVRVDDTVPGEEGFRFLEFFTFWIFFIHKKLYQKCFLNKKVIE